MQVTLVIPYRLIVGAVLKDIAVLEGLHVAGKNHVKVFRAISLE
jgi:hypothetical protein